MLLYYSRKKNVIFWHPWDPWGRINSGKNIFWVQTATVLRCVNMLITATRVFWFECATVYSNLERCLGSKLRKKNSCNAKMFPKGISILSIGSFVPLKPPPLYLQLSHIGATAFMKSNLNTPTPWLTPDSFFATFTNTTFHKFPIHHLTCRFDKTEIPSLMQILLNFVWTDNTQLG